MTQPEAAKKSGGGVLWTGIIFLILSIVGGIGLLGVGIARIASIDSEMQKIPAGSKKTLNLTAGDYTIYTRLGDASLASDVTITGPGGQKVTTTSISGSLSTTSNGITYYARRDFTISSAGNYDVEVDDAGSFTSSSDVVGIGPSWASTAGVGLGLIFGGIFGGGLIFVIGLILLIVGLVKRSKSKRPPTAMPPYGMPGPGYGAPAGYGAPPAPGGYGAPPAPGGYGAPPPAPGGYGAPPPAPGGYPQPQ